MELVANMRQKSIEGLLGKYEGKGLLVRRRRRWEDNNKMVLQRVEFGIWSEIVCFGRSTSVVCF